MIRRTPLGPGAGPNPFQTPRMNVTIVGVEVESSRVMVRDTFGSEFSIDASLRPKGMGMPLPDERWVLAKIGGKWLLETQIGAILPPVIDGDRAGMHPVAKQMLDAMAAHGLVTDLTIDTDPVEPEDDEVTDPAPDDPEADPYVDDGLDDLMVPEGTPEEAPVPVGSTDDDDKVPGSKVSPDLFTAVTYNLAFWVGPKRAKKDLRRLYKFADVIGLQECSHSHRTEALADHPQDWGLFRPEGAGKTNPILWNKEVFSYQDGGTQQYVGSDGPGTFRPARAVNWVRLRHKPTGVVFVYVNFHWESGAAVPGYFAPAMKPDSPRHIERYKTQMTSIMGTLRGLTENYPVLLGGDFNVRAHADLRLRNPGLPTANLGRLGLRSNWDVLGLPPIGTIGSHGTVFDWLMLSNKVRGQMQFVSHKVLRGYRSDHRPVMAKIRVKDFA